MKKFQAKDLCGLIISLSKLAIKHDDAWMNVFLRQSNLKFSRFDSHGLSGTIHALSDLRIQPRTSWMNDFLSQLNFDRFLPQDLANTFSSLSNLKIQLSPEKQAQFLRIFFIDIDDFIPQEFANIVHAFGISNTVLSPDQNEALQGYILKEIFSIQSQHALFLYHQYMITQGTVLLPDEIKMRWEKNLEEGVQKGVSNTESDMFTILQGINSDFKPSYFIPCIASFVDCYNDKTKTIVQFDGPFHFLSDGTYQGRTNFLTRILEQNGYRVIRIHFQDWKRAVNKKHYLQNLIRN